MFAWIKRAWDYSRTVFLNAVSVLAMAGTEIIGYLVGLDWGQIMSPRVAFYMVLGVNLLNIVLRFRTTAPVGEK